MMTFSSDELILALVSLVRATRPGMLHQEADGFSVDFEAIAPNSKTPGSADRVAAEDGCGDGKLDAPSGGELRQFGLDRSGRGRKMASDRRRAGPGPTPAGLAAGRHGDEPRAARAPRSGCAAWLARKLRLSLRFCKGFVAQGAATWFSLRARGLFWLGSCRVVRFRGFGPCPRRGHKEETLSFRGVHASFQVACVDDEESAFGLGRAGAICKPEHE